MGVIRFNDEEVFTTDSQEYEILLKAASKLIGTGNYGAIVEIGTRRGGSMKMIVDQLSLDSSVPPQYRLFVSIDPYGNIPIECTNINVTAQLPHVEVTGDKLSTEITQPLRFDYNDEMRKRIIPSLYYYVLQRGFDFRYFQLTDSEFFKRYSDGIPVYNNKEEMIQKYAFVFFDGPHTTDKVIEEVEFFVPRTDLGSVFVMDDIWMYDHSKVEEILFDNGWEVLDKGTIKASYIKVS